MTDLAYFEQTNSVLVSAPEYNEDGELSAPAVYEDVVSIKPRPESKTLADVDRVMAKHTPSRPDVIFGCIALYLDGLQWDWLESYQVWVDRAATAEAWNEANAGTLSHVVTERVINDDETISYVDTEVFHSAVAIPIEPTRPDVQTTTDWFESNINYRDERQARYIRELSEEGTFEKTIGDMLDAVVEMLLLGNSDKLVGIATKINNIKTDIPKRG